MIVLELSGAARADSGDNHVSADVAEEFGVLSATHTTVTAAYARRIWDGHAYVEARLGTGTTGHLLVVEARAGIGLVFAPSPRVDLLVGWRLGDSYFRGSRAARRARQQARAAAGPARRPMLRPCFQHGNSA